MPETVAKQVLFFRAEELEPEKETLQFQSQEPAVQETASLSSPKPELLIEGQGSPFHSELPKLFEEIKTDTQTFVWGRLQNFVDKRKTLTSDPEILELITGAKVELNCDIENVSQPFPSQQACMKLNNRLLRMSFRNDTRSKSFPNVLLKKVNFCRLCSHALRKMVHTEWF